MARALQAIVDKEGVYRVVIQQRNEGAYMYIYEREDSAYPEWDYLQDDVDMAMYACNKDYGVTRDQWKEIPDTGLHA